MNTRGLINNKEMMRHANQDGDLDKTKIILEGDLDKTTIILELVLQ